MTKKDDRWTLIGLVSWGIKNSCNKAKLPTVYHQVAATIDWIYSHLIWHDIILNEIAYWLKKIVK